MGEKLGSTPTVVDSLVARLVEDLAVNVGAERSYVFRFGGGDALGAPTFGDNTHEWCQDGVAPQMEQLQGVPSEAFPWFQSEILAGRPLLVGSLADLPEEAAGERELLAAQDITSLVAFPIVIDGDTQEPLTWGFVGVDRVGTGAPLDATTPSRVERAARMIAETLNLGARLESEREQLKAVAGRANDLESVSLLSAGLVHDLANLLVISTLHAEILVDKLPADDADRANFLDHALLAERSSGLLRRLVGVLRGQADHAEFFEIDVALASILPSLRRALEPNLRIIQELGAPGLSLAGSVTTLDRIVLNLALNARDAVGSGTLRIATSPKGSKSVVLTVEDDGPGLPEEVRAHAFEPFVSTKGTKGTGLGLSNVARSVEELGGAIHLGASHLGGASFTIVLPLATLTRGPSREATTSDDPTALARDGLVIADERALAVVLCRTLSLSGVSASNITTTTAAADWLHTRKRPLVLVDESVALREFLSTKVLAAHASQPFIVVMTSAPSDAHFSELEEAGILLIPKPFSRSTLQDLSLRGRS